MLSLFMGVQTFLAAGFDAPSTLAIIAGIGGAVSGLAAYTVQRRDVQTKADSSYVTNSLAAMQAILDRQTTVLDRQATENVRLLARVDKQESRIRSLTELLEECQRMCDECLDKVRNSRPSA